jgi:hypothetical protein
MSSDPRDYKLEISGLSKSPAQAQPPRAYLSVMFNCCRVYQRVYKSKNADHYIGRCPKCGRSITFTVGPGGTPQRSFVVE